MRRYRTRQAFARYREGGRLLREAVRKSEGDYEA